MLLIQIAQQSEALHKPKSSLIHAKMQYFCLFIYFEAQTKDQQCISCNNIPLACEATHNCKVSLFFFFFLPNNTLKRQTMGNTFDEYLIIGTRKTCKTSVFRHLSGENPFQLSQLTLTFCVSSGQLAEDEGCQH